jgi:hypothetical protein
MPLQKFLKLIMFLISFNIISGCSTAPSFATLRPLHSEEVIQIVSHQAQSIDNNVDGSESINKGMGIGFATGAEAGFEGGFECGPLFFICSPIFAVVGATVGTVVGGVVGAAEALSEKKAKQLNFILSSTFKDINIEKLLIEKFSTKASKPWQIKEQQFTATINIKIEYFYFIQHIGDELIMMLAASIVVNYPDPAESQNTKRFIYPFKSAKHHVDYWIENNGTNLHDEIHTGLEHISILMVDSLLTPPTIRPISRAVNRK